MRTALGKSREERATAICDQQVELLRECYDGCQHISKMRPGSSDSWSKLLDTRVLNYKILEFTLCQAVPEPQETCIVCMAILCCSLCSDTTSHVTSVQCVFSEMVQGLFLPHPS
jgi:hypothetical protein